MVRGQIVPVEKRHLDIPGKTRRMKVNASIHNRFDIEVLGPDGKVREKATAYNIILDALWTHLSSASSSNWGWFAAISYGSGTGTLSASRTDLFTRIGTKFMVSSTPVMDYSHFDDGYVSYQKHIQIDAGEITGQTIREVGISYDTSANHLMTHAILKDMNGNTVSITVGELDVILIYATVYVHFNPSGYEGGNVWLSCNMAGVLAMAAGVHTSARPSYLFERMAVFQGEPKVDSLVNNYTLLNNASRINDRGGYIGSKEMSVTYTASTKTILARCSNTAGNRIGVSDMNPSNPGGWNGIGFAYSMYQSGIHIRFPNNAKPYCTITDESVGVGDGETLDFALDFGYILNDGSFVLKVDGNVIDPAYYTVDYGKPAHANIGNFLRTVDGNGRAIWDKSTSGNVSLDSGIYEIVENPFYETYGILSFYNGQVNKINVECSNDLENWETIGSSHGVNTVPEAYRNYRYWRATMLSSVSNTPRLIDTITPTSNFSTNSLHFASGHAPASGAAVTASYRTASICKDINHVVDLELVITLNEYTGS